jgi:addiction module HigA family antidote
MGDWTKEIEKEPRVYPPVHPGEVIKDGWLEPLEMTAYELAKEIGVDKQRMYAIIRCQRSITADTALRLGRWAGMRAGFFLDLQSHYDLEMAEWKEGKRIVDEVRPLATA